MPKGLGPPKIFAPEVAVDEEVMVGVRDGGDIPGVTSQGAHAKTGHVVDEICNDHFNDLQGKSCGGGCRRIPRKDTPGTGPPDSGLTSVPNSLDEQLNHCGGSP